MPRIVKAINPLETVIQFDNGTQLEVSPFSGSATQFTGHARGLRSIELPGDLDTSPAFEKALQEIGAYEQETIHVDVTGPSGLRSYTETPQNDRIVLRPAAGRDVEPSVRVVLYQDESGGLSWHFAEGSLLPASQRDALRGSGLRLDPVTAPVFIVPTRTVAAQRVIGAGGGEPAPLRGIITKWGRKVLKVLVIPVVAALLEKPVQSIVGMIERKYRKDLIWEPTPSTYTSAPTEPFKDWGRLNGGRSLLLIHGIFSTVEGMLSGLPQAAMAELHDRYDGRVVAFNHLSVTKSPAENAQYFLEEAKRQAPDAQFEFDVLCHSRGGIVARTLAERGPLLFAENNCRFRKVFFVASPNNGSILGDADHMVDMVDVFTNLLTAFPDGPVMYSIEVLLGIVKLLAYTVETRLPGVCAMGTDDYIQQVLNRSNQVSPAAYAGASSDYEPDPAIDNGFFIGRFGNAIIDRVFEGNAVNVANDLVVPERGVYGHNGHPSFPLLNPLRYKPSDHVWHSGFFRRSETFDAMKRHFDLPVAVPPRGNIEARPQDTPHARPQRRRGGLRSGMSGSQSIPSEGAGPSRASPQINRKGSVDDPHKSSPTATESRTSEAAAPTTASEGAGGARGSTFQAHRNPAIVFHELMKEGEEEDLTVRLDDPAAPWSSGISIDFRADENEIPLSVSIKAPGFEVIGANQATMLVKRERDARFETVKFRLKARNPGAEPKSQEIVAEFWNGNNAIGEATHNTTVVPSAYRGPATPDGSGSATPMEVSSARRQDCDLSITLRGEDTKFAISLRCWVPGEEYSDKDVGTLTFKPEDLPLYASQIIDTKFNAYPKFTLDDTAFVEALKVWNSDFMQYLRNFGKKLWTMLPDEFRVEYLRLRTSVRSIVVYSPELVFPWELVRPFETVGGKYHEYEFLGAAHVFGRWQRKLGLRPKQQRFRVSGFVIMRPRYSANDLDWADDEVNALKGMVANAEEMRPVNNAAMLQLLDRNNVQMVHYTGHGDYQANADLNSLRLEDGPFPALSFLGTRLGQEAQPILYLNACSVGKAAPVAGQMGGFAANCLLGGWSGLIAPYWLINDERAAEFSRSLYAKLNLNRSIGESLQELRIEHPDDPTFLAYSYIGDPWARPMFHQVGLRPEARA